MTTYIDLNDMTEATEAEMDRLCAQAMASLATRLEDECEHLAGRALSEAKAEVESAWETAGEYWQRAVLMTEVELMREGMAAFGGLPDGSLGDVTEVDYDIGESFFEADTAISPRSLMADDE
jgi:hypothetical protein